MSVVETARPRGADRGSGSPVRLAWWRFRSDRLAIVSLAVLGGLLLGAIFAPVITSVLGVPGPDVRHLSALTPFGLPTGPSGHHLLGVDPSGRDIFSRVLYGGRVSLLLAGAGGLLALLAGAVLGAAAGWLGGPTEVVVARGIGVLRAFPAVLLAAALAAACTLGHGCLGGVIAPGAPALLAAVALAGVPPVARTVLAEVGSIRSRDFVAAARLNGGPRRQLLIRELRPNLPPPLLLAATRVLAQSVLLAAALSFLGLGERAPTPSWGGMLAGATPVFSSAWWYVVFPGAALLLTLLACAVLHDAVRTALGRDG